MSTELLCNDFIIVPSCSVNQKTESELAIPFNIKLQDYIDVHIKPNLTMRSNIEPKHCIDSSSNPVIIISYSIKPKRCTYASAN